MSWYVGRSLDVLRDEINASAPNRSKRSDGSIGDAAHSSRTSDHNPCDCHRAVCARDITHDPAGGFNSYSFAEWLRQRCAWGQETRVKYIISNRKIASPKSGWAWRSYTGSNPHSQHVHISVSHGPELFDNRNTWEWRTGSPTPEPPTPSEGTFTLDLQKNNVTPDKREQLKGNGDVFILQQLAQGHFKQLGNPVYDCGNPDGDYGPRTQEAVKQMQRDGGLAADACAGPQTWGYLLDKSGT